MPQAVTSIAMNASTNAQVKSSNLMMYYSSSPRFSFLLFFSVSHSRIRTGNGGFGICVFIENQEDHQAAAAAAENDLMS